MSGTSQEYLIKLVPYIIDLNYAVYVAVHCSSAFCLLLLFQCGGSLQLRLLLAAIVLMRRFIAAPPSACCYCFNAEVHCSSAFCLLLLFQCGGSLQLRLLLAAIVLNSLSSVLLSRSSNKTSPVFL